MLELIENTDPTALAAIEAEYILAQQPIRHWVVEKPEGKSDHSIQFDYPMGAKAVADVLSGPVAAEIPSFNEVNVRRAVLRYARHKPDPIHRAIALGPEAYHGLRVTRLDLRGLGRTIGGEAPVEKVTLHTHDQNSAFLSVRQSLLDMSFKDLRDMGRAMGMRPDEVGLKRALEAHRLPVLQPGVRQLRKYDLEAVGFDSEAMHERLMEEGFYSKMQVTEEGLKPVYLRDSEAPGLEGRTAKAIELGGERPLVDDPYGFGVRREVRLRSKAVLNHVAFPIIRWTEQHGKRAIYAPPKLDITGGFERYDPLTHTVEHHSPILGVALLANCVEADVFREPLHRIFKSNSKNHRTHLPPEASGALVVILADSKQRRHLEWSQALRRLREIEPTVIRVIPIKS